MRLVDKQRIVIQNGPSGGIMARLVVAHEDGRESHSLPITYAPTLRDVLQTLLASATYSEIEDL